MNNPMMQMMPQASQQQHHQMMMQQQQPQLYQRQTETPIVVQLGQQQQQSYTAAQPSQGDTYPFHPVNRLKQLFPELKLALATLLRTSADSVKHESSQNVPNDDVTVPNATETVDYVETLQQAFECFSSICDQMEQCFILLAESERQQSYSNTFLPFNVNLGLADDVQVQPVQPNKFTLNYNQLNIGVKKQIDYARVIYERFDELANELMQCAV